MFAFVVTYESDPDFNDLLEKKGRNSHCNNLNVHM